MLCQFSFKNFKSYKDETVFDLQATSIEEHGDSLITHEKGNAILPVSVIYGPNGGGKTSLLQAMACLISTVVKPIHDLGKNRVKVVIRQRFACLPFAFDESSEKEPTEFKIYFRVNSNEYMYYIAILDEKILSEVLYRRTIGGKKTAVIFEREEENIVLGAKISKKNVNTEVNPKMPYLSFLAINYNFEEITEVQQWFESCIILNYANPRTEQNIFLNNGDEFKNFCITSLNNVGIDVSDYRYDEVKNDFFVFHNIDGKQYSLPFIYESEGTKKLFSILPFFLVAINEGRLVVADELDAKLHPKLLRYIVSLFTNKDINKNGAQLIFTSHDMSIMKKEVFRRDEIWFAALNREHSSELYSLFDIKDENGERIRATSAYYKQYLEGRYGADPYLRKMMEWGKEDESETI